MKDKKAELYAIGIQVPVPTQGSNAVKYSRVITEIKKLKADQQHMFAQLRDHYIVEEQKREAAAKELERIEAEKEAARQAKAAEMTKAKRELLKNVDLSLPVNELPDCKEKYQKIVQEGQMFTDEKFPANEASLGPECSRQVAAWKRASDLPEARLYKDKLNYEDVTQGAIGDCYFLSAMSVLSEKQIRETFV